MWYIGRYVSDKDFIEQMHLIPNMLRSAPSRRRFLQAGVAGVSLLSGCSYLASPDELADVFIDNRTEQAVTADVVVTHSDSGSVVFDRQIQLKASSETEFQDPFNLTGMHHVKVTTVSGLKNEYSWLVRPESDGRNSEMLIITIEDAKIRFTAVE